MSIMLQPFSRSDFMELISWIRTPEDLFIWSATTFTFPLDEDQLEKYYQEAQASNTRLMYTAVDSRTREHMGHIELVRIDREVNKASIAYVLVNPDRRGLGYGQEIMQAILKECFQRMKIAKVDLFVFDFNAVAIHCYQKAGFEIEAVIDDRIKLNDRFVTMYLMGLNIENWAASR
ncbi:MAG: GNAT family N-acetyltransferase [Bacteroidota bacterium]